MIKLVIFGIIMFLIIVISNSKKSSDEPNNASSEIDMLDYKEENYTIPNTNGISIVSRKDNIDKKEYVLPPLSIIEDDESSSFKEAIIQTKKNKSIPIGFNEKSLVYKNISELYNILIGGTIATGKTTYIGSILCSIMMCNTPSEVRFIIYDSKGVDYSIYNSSSYLLSPVISDSNKASMALNKIVEEIGRRYELFSENDTKNIDGYNKKIEQQNASSETKKDKLPYIIIILDDLQGVVNENLEYITQYGSTTGVGTIAVVNRASTNMVSSTLKSNFVTRVSFKTMSTSDSKTILDEYGSEKLGKGEILYKDLYNIQSIKLNVPYITDDDAKRIVHYSYRQHISAIEELGYDSREDDYDDPLYNEIVDFVIKTGKTSASLLQRKYRLGYNRAARMIDMLEERGIIGPPNGSNPREVLVKYEENNKS